ncbi:hypothetical protein [Streptomyces sp. NPDC021096]|uniref:hypothetical protein n=1 Tax=Streptomyces sp. NPDC021096 TaxID=3154792 RepID=UPI0033C002EC
MPRGRHRHSAPLHRLLPPLTVAATSVACAAGALAVGETAVIRGLAVAAAAATVVGSVLMRRWDRAAGKRVAQLTAARTRDEWKTEERIAELETDLEETRLLRTRLEAKLRAKRGELARLRTEHADLLRRYAAAETGRASALERRRLLEKSGAPGAAKALEAAAPDRTESTSGLDASAYRKAADALRDLNSNAADQRAAAAKPAPEVPAAAAAPASPAGAPVKPGGKKQAAKASKPAASKPAASKPAASKSTAPKPVAAKSADPKPAAPAAAVPSGVPAARRPASRAQGGFDFFGNAADKSKAGKKGKDGTPVEEQDLADVVGEEALAEAEADGAVIDLTAHDETEQIDVAELRTAIS